MTIGKYIAAGTGVVALVILAITLLGVAATVPVWLVWAAVVALAAAIVVG